MTWGGGCDRGEAGSDEEARGQVWRLISSGEVLVADKRLERMAASAERAVLPELLYARGALRLGDPSAVRLAEAETFFAKAIETEAALPAHAGGAAGDSQGIGGFTPWAKLGAARARQLSASLALPVGRVTDPGYLSVYEEHPEHVAGQEAYMHYLLWLMAADNAEDLQLLWDATSTFIDRHPKSIWRPWVLQFRSRAGRLRGDGDAALASEMQTLETLGGVSGGRGMDLSSYLFMTATTAEFEAGDFRVAVEHYRQFLASYPNDQRALTARLAVERLEALSRELLNQAGSEGPGAAGGDGGGGR